MTVIQSTPSEQSTSSIKAKCSSSKHKHSKSSMAWGKEALKIVEWSSHSYQFNISTDSGVSIIKCRYEILCIEASRNWRNNYLKSLMKLAKQLPQTDFCLATRSSHAQAACQ